MWLHESALIDPHLVKGVVCKYRMLIKFSVSVIILLTPQVSCLRVVRSMSTEITRQSFGVPH